MTRFDEAYLQVLVAALHDEVREMVAWEALPPVAPQALLGSGLGADDPDREYVAVVPVERERLCDADVPRVTVTVEEEHIRVDARGRTLVIGLEEPVYHYEPDGRTPQEHAGWLAELWMEEAR